MSCVLRIAAPGIAVVVPTLTVQPYRVEGNTAHFDVSRARFNQLAQQIEDAIAFLRSHRADVEVLMGLPSASGSLDFGVENRLLPAQFGVLSPELVCLAGKAGIGLQLSLYALQERDHADA